MDKDFYPLIHINDLLDFHPLSKKTSKYTERMEILQVTSEMTNKSIEDLMRLFGQYIANVIKFRIKDAIETQKIGKKRMKNLYPKLSDKYAKTKNPKHKNHFWVDTEFLVSHITVRKYQNKFIVGFPASLTNKNGVKMVDIFYWLEKGTTKMPARPLVNPIVMMISKNINTYFNQFIKLISSGNIR